MYVAKQHGMVVFKAFGESDDGGEQEQQLAITETAEFKEALKIGIANALATETEGLRGKVSEVIGEKRKMQEKLDALVSKASDDEDREALKSGQIDVQTLIDKKIASRDQTWQEKLAAEQAEKDELKKAVEAERGKLKSLHIRQSIIGEALKNEFFHPTAAEDLAMIASGAWDLTDGGDLIARDKDGNIAMGANGRALTPKEWIEGLQKTRPHYFKQMPGSGGKQGGAGGKTVSRTDWQKMIMVANEKEQKELFEKRASGEIKIAL